MSPIIRRFLYFVLAIVTFVLLGTFGFMYSESMNFLDAVWFSVMTVTTVGYGVPDDFSETGKILSIFMMLFGVGTVLYVLTALALDFFSGSYMKVYKQQLLNKRMKNLNDHIIICGFGRNGRQAARKLILHKKNFVIVDQRELESRDDEFGKETIFIQGNAIDDEVLLKAGVDRAQGIIATLPSDADNLFIVITAKQINKKLKIVSRASNSKTVAKLKSAGADNVIMPDKIGGEHMASLLLTPDLVEFMDYIALEGTKQVNLLEVYTNQLNPSFIGEQIEKLNIFPKSGCKIIGLKDKAGNYSINPGMEDVIEKDCCLFALGKPEEINKLRTFIYD